MSLCRVNLCYYGESELSEEVVLEESLFTTRYTQATFMNDTPILRFGRNQKMCSIAGRHDR